MKNIKNWKSFNESFNNLTFKSEEEFINFWEQKWKDTEAFRFPKEFLLAFPTQSDYSEFEKDEYDYQDEDDEFDFDPGDEVNNISQEFSINIGDHPEDDITEEDWVDFYNSCWCWL
jgi:hypothetical protein